jgi:aminopeptidase N
MGALLFLLFLKKKQMRLQKVKRQSIWLGAVIFFLFPVIAQSQSAIEQTNFDVKFYGLDVKVSDTSTFIEGSTEIIIEILKDSDTLVFNLGSQLEVSKVTIDSVDCMFEHSEDFLYLATTGLSAGQIVSVVIFYSGDGNDDTGYGAIFNRSNEYGNFTYTLTEPFSTKYWFPCKEVLEDKADSVNVYITVPKELKAGSNGLLVDTEIVGTDFIKYKWHSRYPVSFYLISIAVGNYFDYTFYSDLNDTVLKMPIVNYIYNVPEYFNEEKANIDTTGALLKTFSDAFGVYPFYKEKYGHSVAPIGGGMEHQTMTTLVNFGFELVAHELAHQWFGDQVTCKYWNDIWVNEGFASYSEYIALERLAGIEEAKSWMDYTHDYVLSIPDGSVYVPDEYSDDDGRLFDYRLTYKKGAAIIHMIRYELNNDELFFKVLQEYLKRYSYKTATGDNFKEVLEDLSGMDFDNFFNEWYYGEGYPELEINWFQSNDTLYLTNYQTTSAPQITSFFHLKIQYKLVLPTGDTTIELTQNSSEEIYKVYMPFPVYDIVVDPDNYLLNTLKSAQSADTGDMLLKNLLIFPNPSHDKITLFSRSIDEPVDITFYDQMGVKVKKLKKVNPFGTVFLIDDLTPGIYYLHVEYGKSTEIIKIIKN